MNRPTERWRSLSVVPPVDKPVLCAWRNESGMDPESVDGWVYSMAVWNGGSNGGMWHFPGNDEDDFRPPDYWRELEPPETQSAESGAPRREAGDRAGPLVSRQPNRS